MITYKYAKNNKGQRVDISELNHLNKDVKYTCIGCEKEMIPCMGEVKQHYFRHKTVGECSGETYLHILGKMTFKEVYERCLVNGYSFIFQFETEKLCARYKGGIIPKWAKNKKYCSEYYQQVRFDLTKSFSRIALEKKEGEFVPDLQLISESNRVIYIEIAVTHKSEEKKRNSGKQIIELVINRENDIKHIESRLLNSSSRWINTFGIVPKPIVGECVECTENTDLKPCQWQMSYTAGLRAARGWRIFSAPIQTPCLPIQINPGSYSLRHFANQDRFSK